MLSDLGIIARLSRRDEKSLIVTPLICPNQIQAASVDVRLGFHFKRVRNAYFASLDPVDEQDEKKMALDTERYTEDIQLDVCDPFYIHPGEFALATTLEYVKIPTDLGCSLEGRSSLGRLGVTVHSTAGFIDPGFRGRITYEIQNEGTQPVALYGGMRVAQLCFFQLDGPALTAYGRNRGSKYSQQLTTTSSRWYRDKDVRFFRQYKKDISSD